MRIILLLILSLIATSCNNKLKEKIGLESSGPNEYEVQRGKSLIIPPHYNLQDPTNNAAPNVPNKAVTAGNEGEKAFLKELSSD